MVGREGDAARAAREVARAASHLASEAAALARIYAGHGPAEDAALAASEAAVRAAQHVFSLERADPADGDAPTDDAIRASLASLEAASAAVAATRAALDAAMIAHGARSRADSRG